LAAVESSCSAGLLMPRSSGFYQPAGCCAPAELFCLIPATPSSRAFYAYGCKRGCTLPEQGQGVKWEQGEEKRRGEKGKMGIQK